MSVIRKQFLVCDKCGAMREVWPPFEEPPAPFVLPSGYAEGWTSLRRGHHLCPGCAAAYEARRYECARELKRLAGIETMEADT